MQFRSALVGGFALSLVGLLPACSEPEGPAPAAEAPAEAAPRELDQVLAGKEEALVAYLVANPDLLERAVGAYHRSLAREGMEALRALPVTFATGPEDAPVTMVEFFDYHCGYCKRALDAVLELTKDRTDLRVQFVELPILVEESEIAARAALASVDQGRYLDFHAALMRADGRLTLDRIEAIAAELGLDVDRLKADMEKPEIQATLDETRRIAQLVGVNGTPSFLVNGELQVGWDQEGVMALIEAAGESEEAGL